MTGANPAQSLPSNTYLNAASSAIDGEALGEARSQPTEWPLLRQDIEIIRGNDGFDGSASWILHDPAGFRHFNIGWMEFEILSRWSLEEKDKIVEAIRDETTLIIGEEEINNLERFLTQNGLLRLPAEVLYAQSVAMKSGGTNWLAGLLSSQIIFRRVPLFRPQKFLNKILPLTNIFFAKKFWWALSFTFAVSLYLVGREWSAFKHGFASMVSIEGAVTLGLAMIIAKSLHELAHGIATVRYGGMVPTMGVAFIVFWPLLYTETSAAWMISDRKKRIVISVAGILAELILAVLALALWPYLNDGITRDALAFISTTLLFMTLAFNANPLMKFDGYFVLAEFTRLDNMQPRALALLASRIKTILIGKTRPDLEPGLSRSSRNWLLIYGAASLIYRLLLFTTITFAIYYLLPPVAAVPLCIAVLITSLITPFQNFLINLFKTAWHERKWRGLRRTAALVFAILALLLVPIQSTIMVPVIFSSGRVNQIFPPEAGKISLIATSRGAIVNPADILLKLKSPEKDIQLKWALERREILNHLVERSLTSHKLRQEYHIRRSQLSELDAVIAGLQEMQADLNLAPNQKGRVTHILDGLASNVWVQKRDPLIEIVDTDHPLLTAYVGERNLELIEPAAPGRFWLSGQPTISWPVRVDRVQNEPITHLDEPYLAEFLGGPIRVRAEENGELSTDQGTYKINLRLDDDQPTPPLPDIKTMGFVKITTPARSLFERISRMFMAVWHREFG